MDTVSLNTDRKKVHYNETNLNNSLRADKDPVRKGKSEYSKISNANYFQVLNSNLGLRKSEVRKEVKSHSSSATTTSDLKFDLNFFKKKFKSPVIKVYLLLN